ncbi:MAG: hypothetical protein ACTJGQ_00910 [Agrococcus casei]|uniref:hypothetical protein n=1 Tax=Agrococcus casei TaxID=343512 RepID=UPI003F91ED57
MMHLDPMPKPQRGDAFGLLSIEGVCADCSGFARKRPFGALMVFEFHHDATCPNPKKITAQVQRTKE